MKETEQTVIEQMDSILKYLYELEDAILFDDLRIIFRDISESRFKKILVSLENEKNIIIQSETSIPTIEQMKSMNLPHPIMSIVISLKGEILHLNGGYSSLLLSNQHDHILIQTLQQSQIQNVKLTRAIAVATIPMGIYALFQVWDWLKQHYL